MRKKIIAKYTNGNYTVKIYNNGTKVRETQEDDFKPEHPESMDLKITNNCDLGCLYCHEQSSLEGKHCRTSFLYEALKGLPKGIELAIGGGNPMSHPHFDEIIMKLSDLGFICNITINYFHITEPRYDYSYKLKDYMERGLIKGLGVSMPRSASTSLPKWLRDKHVVSHMIAGYHSLGEIRRALIQTRRVLVLGYKNWGRGSGYYDYWNVDIEKRQNEIEDGIKDLMDEGIGVIAFDNLAIDKLDIKKHFSESVWNEIYMGNEGQFTMYFDAVCQEFAINSISPDRVRRKRAIDFFKENRIKGEKK